MTRLTDLLSPSPVEVPRWTCAGTCYVCGLEVAEGLRRKPSAEFTAWAQVYGGDVVCLKCYSALKWPVLRRNSWAIIDGELVLARGGVVLLDLMLQRPSPPTAWYVTRQKQKQGWLSLVWRVSTSRSRLWVATDWADRAIAVEVDWVERMMPLLKALRERKVSRRALREGHFSPATWDKAIRQGWEAYLDAAAALTGNPQWEVMVDAGP